MEKYLESLKILGLDENATLLDIKKSYKELVQVWHPDKFIDKDLKTRVNSELKKLNDAYKYVIANYDQYKDIVVTFDDIQEDSLPEEEQEAQTGSLEDIVERCRLEGNSWLSETAKKKLMLFFNCILNSPHTSKHEKERIKSYHNLIFYGIENSNLHANSPYFFMRDYQGGELVFFFARWIVLAVIALLWMMHFVFVLF